MRVGVIMGGVSSEREVSLETGRGMLGKLKEEKYCAIPIIINDKIDIINKVKDIDFALIALHGKYGEDGAIQGVFEALSLPYSGCGVLSSALCMNKKLSKKIIKSEGMHTPGGITASKVSEISVEVVNKIGYPLVIKPNCGGSSIGTFIAKSEPELFEMACEALKFDNEIIIEKYLEGEEYTVCILNGVVLPIMSIKPSNKFFDYYSKYADNGALEEVAALAPELKIKIQEIALKCWDIFYCKVYARIDIIVSNGIPYLLEINTLPGMTRNSVFPKSAKAVGIDYSELLDLIINYSLIERGFLDFF
jgi:D-alanine-D-alanine ligase